MCRRRFWPGAWGKPQLLSVASSAPSAMGRRTIIMTGVLSEANLQTLPTGWVLVVDQKSIRRDYLFKDFAEAFAFMGQVAQLAERHGHHPDWFNSYNRVEISL